MHKDQGAVHEISIFIPEARIGENKGGALLSVIKREQRSFPCCFCAETQLSVEQVIHSSAL